MWRTPGSLSSHPDLPLSWFAHNSTGHWPSRLFLSFPYLFAFHVVFDKPSSSLDLSCQGEAWVWYGDPSPSVVEAWGRSPKTRVGNSTSFIGTQNPSAKGRCH